MNKKKVLILAYDFPPYNSIGAQRPYSWLKYFNELGFEPIIVTRHWDEIKGEEDYYKASKNQNFEEEIFEGNRVIRTPFKPNLRDKLIFKKGLFFIFLRKVLSLVYNIGQYYSFTFDNRVNLYKAADKILKKETIDFLIVSVEPYVLLRYGYLLHKKYKTPWIADYRDEWTTDSIHLPNIGLQIQFKLFLKKRERNFLSSSRLIVSAAKNYSERISEFLKRDVSTVYNGFFENDFATIRPEIPSEYFEISYIGSLYDYQPLEEFLESIQLFVKEQNPSPSNFKVVFYGSNFNESEKKRILLCKNNLKKYIKTTNRLPRKELHQQLAKKSSVLLILASPDEIRIPGKIFDYLGLRKKILLFKDDNSVLNEIVSLSKNGIISSSTLDTKKTITQLYKNPKILKYKELTKESLVFTRRNQAKKLAELLNRI